MCTDVRGPPELATLSEGAHPAAPILLHPTEHSVTITLPQGIKEEEKEAAIRYGPYASANKEAEFINAGLSEQV